MTLRILAAVAVVLGLAACGGGSSTKTSKADRQHDAVTAAIEVATNRILRLADDADADQLKAATDAVEAARKALDDANALSDADTTALDERISTLEESLDRARTRIADAGQARRLMTAEEARKLTAALSGTRITGISAALQHEAPPIMSGTVPGTPAVSVADLKTAAAGGAATVRGWKRGRYSAADQDADITDTFVLYTNIEAPGTRPFSGEGGKYGAEDLDSDGNLPIVPATDTTLIMAADFPTGPGLRDHEPSPGGTVLIEGSFDGAPGTFVCTPATDSVCRSSVRAGGGYALTGGAWKFVPAQGATVPEPDDEYQYFGGWLRATGGTYAIGAFHGGEGTAEDEFADLAALAGTATYRGPAAGQFAIEREAGDSEAGEFTATATLEMDFGDSTSLGTVTGEIDDFTVTGEIDDFTVAGVAKDWSVTLGSAAIGTHGTISSGGTNTALTRWTIGDATPETTATWSARFHEADRDRTPTVATGSFDAVHGTVGRMTGAFGTTRQ